MTFGGLNRLTDEQQLQLEAALKPAQGAISAELYGRLSDRFLTAADRSQLDLELAQLATQLFYQANRAMSVLQATPDGAASAAVDLEYGKLDTLNLQQTDMLELHRVVKSLPEATEADELLAKRYQLYFMGIYR